MEQDFLSILIQSIGIVAAIFIVKCIFDYIVKDNFLDQYGIQELPWSIKVRKKRKKAEKNYYYLEYPCWTVSKKDGTADRRVKKNSIIWGKSCLYVDNYLVFSKRPYDLIDTVKKLRLESIDIELCKEENKKRENILKKKEAFAHNTGIQNIVDYYSEKPTNFEVLCSEIFESQGYTTKLTPPTNDGGYDILLNKEKERVIVECKCYSINHKVGRPSIQKLVGANNIVSADRMVFVTTSDFSSAAIDYAKETGVELINGHKLMDLLDKQGFIMKEKVEIDVMECQLEVSDLYPYVPDDIFEKFFN